MLRLSAEDNAGNYVFWTFYGISCYMFLMDKKMFVTEKIFLFLKYVDSFQGKNVELE